MNSIKHLETQYLKAKVAYYDGNPIMSDAAFDILEQQLKDAGSKVVEQIGAKRKDFDFPHPTPMKSLAKIQTEVGNYQENEFANWLLKQYLKLKAPIDYMISSPKFDGSAINIIYRDTQLESILTRGDGKFGKDVTDRFKVHLPEKIDIDGIVEIRCEAVMAKSIFEKKYADKFANARNIVAGVIGKDDIDIEMISDLTLMPIHILINGIHNDISIFKVFTKNYPIFPKEYFDEPIQPTATAYKAIFKAWEEKREKFDYQLDGIVFSLPCEVRETLGENNTTPHWSIAVKFIPEESITVITGIEWNLGKTGELTPVILLKPVQLAGTTVKRVSGYNAGYIVKNNIQPGTIVSLHKSGDIIPEIKQIIFSPKN